MGIKKIGIPISIGATLALAYATQRKKISKWVDRKIFEYLPFLAHLYATVEVQKKLKAGGYENSIDKKGDMKADYEFAHSLAFNGRKFVNDLFI